MSQFDHFQREKLTSYNYPTWEFLIRRTAPLHQSQSLESLLFFSTYCYSSPLLNWEPLNASIKVYSTSVRYYFIYIYKYIMTFLSYSLGYTTYITLEKLSLNTFVKTSSKRHRMISFYKLWEIQNIQLKWNHWKGFQLWTTADYFKIQSPQNVIKLILVTSKIPGFLSILAQNKNYSSLQSCSKTSETH